MGLAAVGYGAYKGVQYLIENNSSPDGDEINAAIEKGKDAGRGRLRRSGSPGFLTPSRMGCERRCGGERQQGRVKGGYRPLCTTRSACSSILAGEVFSTDASLYSSMLVEFAPRSSREM